MSANQVLLIILAGLAALFTGAGAMHVLSRSGPDAVQQQAAGEQTREAAIRPAAPAAPETAKKPDAAPPQARPQTAVPVYDVVRIEKGGEGVIAGRAEPGWRVIVQSGDTPVADATADRFGEWVAILKEPLPPGEHSLSLRAYSPDGNLGLVSDQTVVVSVAQKASEETVVALAEPGAATKVLQREQTPPAAAEPAKSPSEQAAAPTAPATVPQQQTTAPATTQAPQQQAAAPATTQEPQQQAAPAQPQPEPQAQPTPRQTQADAPKAAPQETAVASVSPPAAPAPVQTPPPPSASQQLASTAPSFAMDKAPQVVATATLARQPEQRTAAATPPAASPEASAASQPTPAAPAATADLGVATSPSAGEQADEPSGQVAPSTRIARAAPAQDRPAPTAQPAAPAEPPPATAKAPVAFDAVDYEDAAGKSQMFLSGVGEPGARIMLYMNNALIAETEADESGKWTVAESRRLEPGSYVLRADQLHADGKVTSRAEVTFERAPPAAVVASLEKAEQAMQAKEAEATKAATANASAPPQRQAAAPTPAPAGTATADGIRMPARYVVRRGDTLWDIAELYYGGGWRYTAIFRSNRNQIRDPDLIYPDQKFQMPEGQ